MAVMKKKQDINRKREELYLKLFGNLYIKFDKLKKNIILSK